MGRETGPPEYKKRVGSWEVKTSGTMGAGKRTRLFFWTGGGIKREHKESGGGTTSTAKTAKPAITAEERNSGTIQEAGSEGRHQKGVGQEKEEKKEAAIWWAVKGPRITQRCAQRRGGTFVTKLWKRVRKGSVLEGKRPIRLEPKVEKSKYHTSFSGRGGSVGKKLNTSYCARHRRGKTAGKRFEKRDRYPRGGRHKNFIRGCESPGTPTKKRNFWR